MLQMRDSVRKIVIVYLSFVVVSVVCIFFCVQLGHGQDNLSSDRSSQAVALLQHVLNVSGGAVLISSISDLTATGSIEQVMNDEQSISGNIKIFIKGADQLRIDATLPTGTTSYVDNHGSISHKEDDRVPSMIRRGSAVKEVSHYFPIVRIATALTDDLCSIGLGDSITDSDTGHILYNMHLECKSPQVALTSPRSLLNEQNYFIDSTTYYIVRVQNCYYPGGRVSTSKEMIEDVRFDSYKSEQGIMMPHAISVSIGKRLLYTIHIASFRFNQNLNEADFTFSNQQR
jgi:outer membrane lipoprotein-sorting protein